MYREYVNKVLCRVIYIAGGILTLIAIIGIIMAMGDDKYQWLLVQEGIGLVFVLICMILIPRITLRQFLRLDQTLHNGEHPECHVTFSDKITIEEGEQRITVDYENVQKIYRLKRCSVLMIGKQNGIIYEENSFTVGNAEDFEKFILRKCRQVKYIERR